MTEEYSEYLQAMGVDIYVPRYASELAESKKDLKTVQDFAVINASNRKDNKLVSESIPADPDEGRTRLTEFFTSAPESEVPESEEIIALDPDVLGEKTDHSPVNRENTEVIEKASEKNPVPGPVDESSPAEPLYFLWQQVGEVLFLTTGVHRQSAEENKLMAAIVMALGRNERVEKGTGNWPLVGSVPGNKAESQNFLSSFVDGRAQISEGILKLVLFGEKSRNQFPQIQGGYNELLGSVISAEATSSPSSKLNEYRILPALEDMLEKPYLKSLAWQSIKDLRES